MLSKENLKNKKKNKEENDSLTKEHYHFCTAPSNLFLDYIMFISLNTSCFFLLNVLKSLTQLETLTFKA